MQYIAISLKIRDILLFTFAQKKSNFSKGKVNFEHPYLKYEFYKNNEKINSKKFFLFNHQQQLER